MILGGGHLLFWDFFKSPSHLTWFSFPWKALFAVTSLSPGLMTSFNIFTLRFFIDRKKCFRILILPEKAKKKSILSQINSFNSRIFSLWKTWLGVYMTTIIRCDFAVCCPSAIKVKGWRVRTSMANIIRSHKPHSRQTWCALYTLQAVLFETKINSLTYF